MKKENTDTKATLKQKERIHDELCFEIFMIINTVDQKEWNNSFVKIYQSYIKEDKFRHRQVRKKDHTSEEINRHLVHVEQSLFQITSGNMKSIKRKEEEITKKMEENSLLLYELNVMRKN